MAWAISLGYVLLRSVCAQAIEGQPTRLQIEAALEGGKLAAAARTPPDRLYQWFGSTNELEPRGFLVTKLAGLTVMSTHFALRSAIPSDAEINRILVERTFLISLLIFGDRPNFAVDSYVVLLQGQRTIKPITVRFDGQASRTAVWPNAPAYRAKVVASFSYGEVDLRAKTRISVFPGSGGELSFDVDFKQID
ncbi:MAG: hypothetical protein ACREIL_10480 [Nitrospiraceae bacterium]